MKNFVRVTLRGLEEPEVFIKDAKLAVVGGFIMIYLVTETISNTFELQEFLKRQFKLQVKFRKLEEKAAETEELEGITYTFEINGEEEAVEEAWICLETDVYDAETVEVLPEGAIVY